MPASLICTPAMTHHTRTHSKILKMNHCFFQFSSACIHRVCVLVNYTLKQTLKCVLLFCFFKSLEAGGEFACQYVIKVWGLTDIAAYSFSSWQSWTVCMETEPSLTKLCKPNTTLPVTLKYLVMKRMECQAFYPPQYVWSWQAASSWAAHCTIFPLYPELCL